MRFMMLVKSAENSGPPPKALMDAIGKAAEEATKPLSDQDVALVLRGQGLTIARRTVAKYRMQLAILPSSLR